MCENVNGEVLFQTHLPHKVVADFNRHMDRVNKERLGKLPKKKKKEFVMEALVSYMGAVANKAR